MKDRKERLYSFSETVVDIAFNVGAYMGKGKLKGLDRIGDSRSLVAWIIRKAEAFEEVYQKVEWDVTEGFGDYIEAIDRFTVQALKDQGLLMEEETL